MRIGDRYAVIAEIGGGGMGTVYLARDEKTGGEVAVKVLRPRGDVHEAARRLRREARAANVLDSTRVAKVFDVGETADGAPYLVMEYVRGTTVRARLRERPMAREEALRIVREVATTLAAAHAAGLVHRDVKPDNVIVRDDGRVVLLDFGIVKQLDASEDASQVSTQLTSEGTLIGTPAYLAPEQALGHAIGPEVDQFALAVMAFEMLTGRLPWTATEVTHLLAQLLAERPPAASSVRAELPRAFDAVLWRALSKSPAARFTSVAAFAEALDAAERGEVIEEAVTRTFDAPSAAPPRGRGVLLLAGMIALTTAGVWLASRAVAPRRAAPEVDASALASPLDAPGAVLACPILEARGVDDVATWVGAAAGSLICRRAIWFLGGRGDRTLPPAALLDVPIDPVEKLPNPYASAIDRARSIETARRRAAAYVDGTIAYGREGWRATVSLFDARGREVARADGAAKGDIGAAILDVTDRLWPTPAPIDPEVARWTGFPDAEIGLARSDLSFYLDALHSPACAAIRRRAPELSSAVRHELWGMCTYRAADPFDAGPLTFDESTPEALAASVLAYGDGPVPEPARIGAKLDALRAAEGSRVGRAMLAHAAGRAWSQANDRDRARAATLASVHEDPTEVVSWFLLSSEAYQEGGWPMQELAAAWFPSEATFYRPSIRTDEIDERLRRGHLGHLFEPTQETSIGWGLALADAGRAVEARALAVTPLQGQLPDPMLATTILARVDFHDAKVGRAIARLREHLDWGYGQADLLMNADVAGALGAIGDDWAKQVVAMSDAEATDNLGWPGGVLLCMHARAALALRCLARAPRPAESTFWGGPPMLLGAQRYARGDDRGAAAAWKGLVTGPSSYLTAMLPTDAFERAGEDELAARVDARKASYAFVAGLSEAAPREAKRAYARGDRDRAREIAQSVVTAWSVADVPIPAVDEMRALLQKLAR